jgi:hypothetical protein|nr:hypothetical protein [Neorhizobium tomejilense]
MFDVIDVARCGDLVLSRFDKLVNTVRDGGMSDTTGARLSVITMEEAYGMARAVIAENVRFESDFSHRYLAQFPEILAMPLVGQTVSDSVEHGLYRAVFGRIEQALREAVVAQYSDYGVEDLDRAVSNGLAMFDRYLVNDPFARLRIRPDKVLSHLSDIHAEADVLQFKKLKGQIDALASELKTRPLDARHVARMLREASQFCVLAASGEVAFDREPQLSALAMAMAS